MCVQSLGRVQLFATPWTVTCQAPLSMELSRQEYWSRLLFPTPGNLPNTGIKPESLACCIGRYILYHCATRETRKDSSLRTDCFGYLEYFVFSNKFQDCLFYFCEKRHWNFHKNCIEYVIDLDSMELNVGPRRYEINSVTSVLAVIIRI